MPNSYQFLVFHCKKLWQFINCKFDIDYNQVYVFVFRTFSQYPIPIVSRVRLVCTIIFGEQLLLLKRSWGTVTLRYHRHRRRKTCNKLLGVEWILLVTSWRVVSSNIRIPFATRTTIIIAVCPTGHSGNRRNIPQHSNDLWHCRGPRAKLTFIVCLIWNRSFPARRRIAETTVVAPDQTVLAQSVLS